MTTTPLSAEVAVLGAGAIGCFLGGCLAAAGQPVNLLGRPRFGEILATHALQVAGLKAPPQPVPPGTWHFIADERAYGPALAQARWILVCVKSGQTRDAAALIRAHAPGHATVISFQNGIHNAEVLREQLGQTVLAGMVPFNVEHTEPGTFRQLTSGHLYVERPENPDAANALQALLARIRTGVALRTDMPAVQWSKLILNLNNAVNALSGLPLREMLLNPDYRKVLASAQSEALDLLRAAGQPLVRLGAIWPPMLPPLLRLPTPLFRLVARSAIDIDPQARSSMQADLRSGRLTEVDVLNGEVVRLARSLGREAPVNQALVALIHRQERAGRFVPVSAADLRSQLGV